MITCKKNKLSRSVFVGLRRMVRLSVPPSTVKLPAFVRCLAWRVRSFRSFVRTYARHARTKRANPTDDRPTTGPTHTRSHAFVRPSVHACRTRAARVAPVVRGRPSFTHAASDGRAFSKENRTCGTRMREKSTDGHARGATHAPTPAGTHARHATHAGTDRREGPRPARRPPTTK